jgi:hypothetical protein
MAYGNSLKSVSSHYYQDYSTKCINVTFLIKEIGGCLSIIEILKKVTKETG